MRRRRAGRVGPFTNIRREPGAWSVRVLRRGKPYADYFSDAVYGGREKSLLGARRRRDELLTQLPPDTRVRRRAPEGVRSETGIVGVTLERYRVEGRAYQRYVASWQDTDGVCHRKRFSVGRYGPKKAKALAAAARKGGVETTRRALADRQRAEAKRRLSETPPMPRQVKDPLSREGITMPPRRPRRSR